MGSWRVATDARTAAGAVTAPKMAAAASSAAPTVSVLRRRTRNRGRGASLFPRFSLRLKYKNIRISSPFYFGRGYAIIFSFMPWTLCTSFGFFKLGSPFECGMAPSPQVPQSFLHRFSLYCLISVIDKVNIFVYSNKTPWQYIVKMKLEVPHEKIPEYPARYGHGAFARGLRRQEDP